MFSGQSFFASLQIQFKKFILRYTEKLIIMKRIYSILSLLLLSFVAFGSELGLVSTPQAIIPDDPAVRRGVLKSGLSYYVRHNARPKGQADFYILSDVGAIQEDDDQQGLAHFLEHMAFNGTKNMPDKEIINYLESIGVKFGANLNAATSWDYTIYMMKDLPTQRPNTIDSALLILHDWAGFIEPKNEEIDKERGVIKEELRTRDGASWRSMLSLIAALGRGTKYEHRNLIGSLEGLDSFEAESLVRFYHDWYTPDHQAIIIVGDVDVDYVESQIKSRFKDLPAAARSAPKKEVIEVASNAEPLVNIYSDKEMQYSMVQYFIRRKALANKEASRVDAARKNIEEAFVTMMQNSRIDEVVMSPDATIVSGGMSLGRVGVIPTMEATVYAAQSPEGGIREALQEVVTQMERTRRYGFQSGEFERAREDLMSSVRSSYLNRNDRTNNSFINRYVNNYRFGEAIPSAEMEWQIDSTLIASMSLDEVNRRVSRLFSDDNHVVSVVLPDKEGLLIPTEELLLETIETIRNGDVGQYEDSVSSDRLLSDTDRLFGADVVEESTNSDFGTTEWQLANGATIVVRPSTLKADEVILNGYSAGGRSVLDDEQYLSGLMLSSLMSNSGIGEYSAVELTKVLSGKMAGLSTYVSEHSHGVRGRSTPADIETLLQLLYLNFAAPRFSDSDFETFRRRVRSNNENQATDPDYLAERRYAEVVYNGAKRKMPLSIEMIDSLRLADFVKTHQVLFSDVDNFRFTIVGNVDLEVLKPLVELYIGSLKSDLTNEKMSERDLGVRAVKGIVQDNFDVKMEQPKVGVQMLYWGEGIDYSLRNSVIMSYFKAALDDLLLESVREELGGTYGVGVSMSIAKRPFEYYRVSLRYDTNEEQIDHMQDTIIKQLERIATEGVAKERMDKTREYLLKSFGNTKEHNSGWLGYINSLYVNDIDYLADYEKVILEITSDDVRNIAQKILSDENRVEVIMHPKK